MKKQIFLTIGASLSLMVFSCQKSGTQAGQQLGIAADNSPKKLETITVPTTVTNWHPGHYSLLGDGDAINTTNVPSGFRGVQKKYLWKDLESTQGTYDFSSIITDLQSVSALSQKFLVVQIQTKAFGTSETAVPNYVLNHTSPHKWVYTTSTGSLNPVYWDTDVSARIQALYTAMGNALNGRAKLEAVIISETALSSDIDKNDQTGVVHYTDTGYQNGLNAQMNALRDAFPNQVVIQYTNYKPILASVVGNEDTNGIGLGGPDINASTPGLNGPGGAYSYYTTSRAAHIPLGAAVQYADYISPTYASVNSIYTFAKNTLHLHYMFWLNRGGGYFTQATALVQDLTNPSLGGDVAGGLIATKPNCYN